MLTRAENAGITVGNRHRADFQDDPVEFVTRSGRHLQCDAERKLRHRRPRRRKTCASCVARATCPDSCRGSCNCWAPAASTGRCHRGGMGCRPGSPTCRDSAGHVQQGDAPPPCTSPAFRRTASRALYRPVVLRAFRLGRRHQRQLQLGRLLAAAVAARAKSGKALEGCVAAARSDPKSAICRTRRRATGCSRRGRRGTRRFGLYKNGAGKLDAEDGAADYDRVCLHDRELAAGPRRVSTTIGAKQTATASVRHYDGSRQRRHTAERQQVLQCQRRRPSTRSGTPIAG